MLIRLPRKWRLPLASHGSCFYSSSTKNPYSSTVLLPKTDFPSKLNGKSRLKKDKELLQTLKDQKAQFSSAFSQSVSSPDFIIHDGPPYANGDLHLGHALNKILKDILARRQRSLGKSVHFVPGWDTHGLPIELKASQGEKRPSSPIELRETCRKFALDVVGYQSSGFQSWGIDASWETPYITCERGYVQRQFEIFGDLYLKRGSIFRDLLPVYWSPSSGTALAESELEYVTKKSPSVYVKFPLGGGECFALIWTTTPWSLFSNKAICFAPTAKYVFARFEGVPGEYLVAEALLNSLPFRVQSLREGNNLGDGSYTNFQGEPCPFVASDHVKLDSGTGLVHTAPCHGHEDFRVGKAAGLGLENKYIDTSGRFTFPTDGHPLEGVSIFEDHLLLDFFKESILLAETIEHSYPCDWRTKEPVIVSTSRQWFFDTQKVSQRATQIVSEEVEVSPPNRKGVFLDNLKSRPYWCISRQRVWGVPIPVFYSPEGSPLVNEKLIQRCVQLVDSHGTDFWWMLSNEEILQGTGLCGGDELIKGEDIFDVWFDSGISWSTLPTGAQADVYLEGYDQFNGWFYSSLMTSIAQRGISPFKKIFVHGFTMDGKGRKMSKSLGNVVSPNDIVFGQGKKTFKTPYGVDVLRYWVAAHGSLSPSILVTEGSFADSKVEVDRIRNALKFCLGNLGEEDGELHPPTTLLDKYIYQRLALLDWEIGKLYEGLDLGRICRLWSNFISNDLSGLYFLGAKDRLYCDPLNSHSRRSAISTLSAVLESLSHWIEPILPLLHAEISEHASIERRTRPEVGEDTFPIVEGLLSVRDDILRRTAGNKKWTLVIFSLPDESVTPGDLREILRAEQVVMKEEFRDEDALASYTSPHWDLRVYPGVSLKPCLRCRLLSCSEDNSVCLRCQALI